MALFAAVRDDRPAAPCVGLVGAEVAAALLGRRRVALTPTRFNQVVELGGPMAGPSWTSAARLAVHLAFLVHVSKRGAGRGGQQGADFAAMPWASAFGLDIPDGWAST